MRTWWLPFCAEWTHTKQQVQTGRQGRQLQTVPTNKPSLSTCSISDLLIYLHLVQMYRKGCCWQTEIWTEVWTEWKIQPSLFYIQSCTENSPLTLLDRVTIQQGSKLPYTRILFMKFSSVFNTVNNNILLQHISLLQVHKTPNLRIREFLCDMPQYGMINNGKSSQTI